MTPYWVLFYQEKSELKLSCYIGERVLQTCNLHMLGVQNTSWPHTMAFRKTRHIHVKGDLLSGFYTPISKLDITSGSCSYVKSCQYPVSSNIVVKIRRSAQGLSVRETCYICLIKKANIRSYSPRYAHHEDMRGWRTSVLKYLREQKSKNK